MIIDTFTLILIAAVTTGLALLLGFAGMVLGLRAGGNARAARRDAEVATLRLAEIEELLARQRGQIDELLAGRGQDTTRAARPSLREAVALCRHGAGLDELMSTCRIGQSEARLIQMLYGSAQRPDPVAPDAGVH